MKLTIERTALQKALAHVQSVVERRTTIPILSNVMIEGADDSLSLTATDMDIAIVEKVPADVAAPGAITLPAHTLYDIVRKLPEGSQISFEGGEGGGHMEICAGRSRFSLSCLGTDEFPVMTNGDLPHGFTLSAALCRNLVDRTRFAMSSEETRYYLNGIYFHTTDEDSAPVLRVVATDGHRLARMETPQPDGAADMPGVIVPRKAVTELRKLIEDNEVDIAVALSDNKIRFTFDNVVLTSKLIDGTFPDYQRVIPEGNDKHLEVDCKPFAEAVDRVSTISTEKSRAVKVALDKNSLTLSSSSPESGTATEEMEVTYDADPVEIGFNSRYLLDITQQIEGGTARFDLADASSPTIVRDAADGSALYVLMPMRV